MTDIHNLTNPCQTVLLSCRGKYAHFQTEEEGEDLIPLNWHTAASADPFIYAVLVSKKTDAIEIIRTSGTFVVNFIPFKLKDSVVEIGKHSSAHHDKFKIGKLTRKSCEKLIDNVRVGEAAAWIECQVMQELDAGDHILFLGNVLYSELTDPGALRLFYKDKNWFTTTKE